MKIQDIKVSDLALIKELKGVHSIRELARRMSVDPQNLTKRIKMLEKTLGAQIVNRSSKGISLTQQGEYLSREFSDQFSSLTAAFQFVSDTNASKQRIRLCGRGFMVSHFLYRCGQDLLNTSDYHLDLMDLSPEQTERAARQGLLDIVLSFEDILLGPSWMRKEVGTVKWGFFARANHPLQETQEILSLKGNRLLGFSYIESDRIIQLANANQLDLNALRSHGCENSKYSLMILKKTDAIACLPDIAVQEELDAGSIIRLNVKQTLRQRPLVLSINKDYVSGKTAKDIASVFQESH